MKLRLFLLLLLLPIATFGTTYYIDSTGGSNSNPGTKVLPWKSHPYMLHNSACDGAITPTYTHVAGDQFIFKGGDTWPAACFSSFPNGMIIPAGGSSAANPDVYTTDNTWFNGASFTRPIWDMQNTFAHFDSTINIYAMIHVHASNITFGTVAVTNSGFDMRNLNITAFTNNQPGVAYIAVGLETGGPAHLSNVIVTQSWCHAFFQSAPIPQASDGSAQYPYATCLGTHADPNVSIGSNIVLDHSEVSNTENLCTGSGCPSGSPHAAVGMCAVKVAVSFTHCHDLFEGIRPYLFIHDTEINLINNPLDLQYMYPNDGAANHILHLDTIQGDGSNGLNEDVWNNYIHDVTTYAGTMNLNYLSKCYNNVVTHVAQTIALMDAGCPQGGCAPVVNGGIYNNTFDGSVSTNPVGHPAPIACGDQTHGTITFTNTANNICIGQGGGAMPAYGMSTTEATNNSFTAATKFKGSVNDTNIAGAGVNETSLCNSGFPSLCSDTQGAPWFGGTAAGRPTSGNWDRGAYVLGAAPPPPNCFTSGGSWTNTSFTAQSGNFSTTPFTILPNGTPAAGSGGSVVALSQSSGVNTYGANSVLIRQGDDGFWQVFSGPAVGYIDIPNARWSVGRADSFVITANVPVQTYSATVTFSGVCAGGCPSATVTFRASATSLGFWNLDPADGAASLTVCNFGIATTPTGSLNPASLTFPSQVVGTTSPALTFTFTNNGPGALTISTITLTGDYAQTNNCPFSSPGMPPNTNCTFNVSFIPTVLGPRPGSITIVSNASNSPAVETLSGTGVTTTTLLNGAIIQNGAIITQ